MNWNKYNSDWKKLLGFSNMQKKFEKSLSQIAMTRNIYAPVISRDTFMIYKFRKYPTEFFEVNFINTFDPLFIGYFDWPFVLMRSKPLLVLMIPSDVFRLIFRRELHFFISSLVKFGLSEKRTKFEKIFLVVLTNQLIYLVKEDFFQIMCASQKVRTLCVMSKTKYNRRCVLDHIYKSLF